MSSVINEFSLLVHHRQLHSSAGWEAVRSSSRELLALLDEGSGTLLGVVCADLPSTTSGVDSSTNLEGDRLLM